MKAAVIYGAMLVIVGAAALGAQDPLSAARDLYTAAAYEDALSTLNGLGSGLTPELDRQAKEYRAFCLYALGRTREADTVVESLIREAPLTALTAVDVSPRLEQMFSAVRKRVLPSLIRERYRAARAALDQKNFAVAEPHLTEARLMIAEAAKVGVADEMLADMSVLIDGFLELIQSTESQRVAQEPAPTPAAPLVAPVVAPPPSAPRVYSAGDEGVESPVVIEQRMPALTPEMRAIIRAWGVRGVLSVMIDETGSVIDATIRPSMNTSFDAAILGTVRQWKYQPAKKDGVPVRYLKMFALVP
jgi:TonB family protein